MRQAVWYTFVWLTDDSPYTSMVLVRYTSWKIARAHSCTTPRAYIRLIQEEERIHEQYIHITGSL